MPFSLLTAARALARIGPIALLLVGLAVDIAPAVAAPLHQPRDARSQRGGEAPPFNIDQNPCGPVMQGRGAPRGGQGDCYAYPPPDRQRRGGDFGGRGPGSNAFGLQFNNGY